MTLAYRGVKYERDSLPLEMKTGDIGGKYRGQDWNHHYPRHMLQLEPKLHRQYRGVAYSTRPHLAPSEQYSSSSGTSFTNRSREW